MVNGSNAVVIIVLRKKVERPNRFCWNESS